MYFIAYHFRPLYNARMSHALETLGARIKAMRRANGLSQRQLSELAGMPQAHISRIEAGAVDLRVTSLLAIAHALDHEFAAVPHWAAPFLDSLARSGPGGQRPAQTLVPERLDYNG